MPALTLSLLGGFRACLDARSLTLSKKAQALLAHLALSPGQGQTRARLAGLLWGDRADEQARNSLRQTLFELRRELGPDGERALAADHERVALTVGDLRVDALEFARLAEEDTPGALEGAAALYAGELLAGLVVKEEAFESWLYGERERLHELGLRALGALLAQQAAAGVTDRAIETALRLLALDPLRETAHRALMRLYASQGRGAAALRRYQICVETLWRELRVEPEPETKQLYQEILAQRSTQSPAGAGARRGSASATPLPGEPSLHLPLIGRVAELERARAELRGAGPGRGHVVAVLGEAGIGKTRLIEEITAGAARDGHRLIQGRAHPSEQILPFGLWVTALRGSQALDEPETLKGLAAPWRQELARLFPELGTRTSGARSGIDDHLRIFEAVGELLDLLARKQPLAVVLEDVHWADQTSLRLVAFLARRLRGERVSLLLTARVEEVDLSPFTRGILAELAREPGLAEIGLAPLARDETWELVRALAGRAGGAADPALEERVWRASEGNPLVVVETMRTLHERGPAALGDDLPIPEGVRRILGERLDRLSERPREVVGVAAVIGREFDLGILQEAAGLDARGIAEAMEELVRRRILHQDGEHIDFTHDRIRELAYDQVVEPRRRLLHAAVAAAIERQHAQDLEPHRAALAGHYRRALVWDKAVAHLGATASQAAERGAYRDAVGLFEEAFRAMDHLALDGPGLERAIEMRLETRDLLVTLGEISLGFGHLEEAERLARRLGDERRLAEVLYRISHSCWLVGDQSRALELCAQIHATATTLGDVHLRVMTDFRLGQVYNALGDYPRAVEYLERDLDVLPGMPNPSRSLGIPHVIRLTWLALSLAELGRFAEAVAVAERARGDAEVSLQRYTIFYAIFQLGRVHLVRGDAGRAVPTLEQSHALAETWQIGLMRATCADNLAHAYVLAGRHEAAGALLGEGLPAPRSYGASRAVSRGECFLALGRPGDAEAQAQAAIDLARRFGERGHEAKALCLLAAVRARQDGGGAEARRLYRDARTLAEELGMRPLVARCQLGLGRAAELEGDRSTAQTEIERATATFRELDMPYWLAQAQPALVS
jgi:DNA-binding SARP family transcriptional activator